MSELIIRSNIDKFRGASFDMSHTTFVPRVGDTIIDYRGLRYEVYSVTYDLSVRNITVECNIPKHLTVNGKFPEDIVKLYLQ
jgi:hypothetical protein